MPEKGLSSRNQVHTEAVQEVYLIYLIYIYKYFKTINVLEHSSFADLQCFFVMGIT